MQHFKSNPLTTIDYDLLRSEVTIEQVLTLFEFQAISMSGKQLRGPCPVHKSLNKQSRSFSVNVERNIFQCFGCNAKGNQLDLAAAVFDLPLYEAAKQLCLQLGIQLPTK